MQEKIKFIHVVTTAIILLSSVVILWVLIANDFEGSELRTQVVTAALSLLVGAAGYWLGSSDGSHQKTELLTKKGDK